MREINVLLHQQMCVWWVKMREFFGSVSVDLFVSAGIFVLAASHVYFAGGSSVCDFVSVASQAQPCTQTFSLSAPAGVSSSPGLPVQSPPAKPLPEGIQKLLPEQALLEACSSRVPTVCAS